MKYGLLFIAGWIIIYAIKFFFGKDKKDLPQPQPQSKKEEAKPIEAPKYRPIPTHNCRRRTPGRKIQEIILPDNTCRLIYHTY